MIVSSEIKSDRENEFKSLGTQLSILYGQCFGQKVHFSVENVPYRETENLGSSFSIFHNLRNLASFSLHFEIIKWMFQPLIIDGIITIIKGEITTKTILRGCAAARMVAKKIHIFNSYTKQLLFISS